MLIPFILVVFQSLSSMVMIQVPSQDIVNNPAVIVYAEVVEKESRKNSGGIIFTYYTVDIQEDGRIKSEENMPDTLTVKAIGGTVGRETLDVPGVPVLSVGARYVLFLEKRENTNYDIYAANQGCMHVIVSKGNKFVRPCENQYFNAIYLEDVSLSSAPKKKVKFETFIDKLRSYQNK